MVASSAEILIVEDDEVIMGTLAYNLSRQGFGVQGATTGAEALRIARRMRPDLILLDVMLPGESGMEVCERIRDRDQEVVIVMVTASRFPPAIADAVDTPSNVGARTVVVAVRATP